MSKIETIGDLKAALIEQLNEHGELIKEYKRPIAIGALVTAVIAAPVLGPAALMAYMLSDKLAHDIETGVDSTKEADHRDALAEQIGGKTEVPTELGRVDVLTDDYAIEVGKASNYKADVGQALAYADATGKEPVVATYGELTPAQHDFIHDNAIHWDLL